MCIMSVSHWRAIDYPFLTPSLTIFKFFDGHTFQSYGILTAFPIRLGGKTILMEVEVVDSPIEYNLMLGCTWFYAMKEFISLFLDSSISLIKEILLLLTNLHFS